MGYAQFVDAVCLTGMFIYSHNRFKNEFITYEAKLEAFMARVRGAAGAGAGAVCVHVCVHVCTVGICVCEVLVLYV